MHFCTYLCFYLFQIAKIPLLVNKIDPLSADFSKDDFLEPPEQDGKFVDHSRDQILLAALTDSDGAALMGAALRTPGRRRRSARKAVPKIGSLKEDSDTILVFPMEEDAQARLGCCWLMAVVGRGSMLC